MLEFCADAGLSAKSMNRPGLQQALELAKGLPVSTGSIEVRPVAFRPDAA
jgi:hypothetical protein